MKKKISLSFVLFLLIGSCVFSQTYVILVKPMGSKEWGYADLKGKLIIEPKFRTCTEFSEDGFATIYDANIKKFYFINLKGETLKTEITDFKLSEFFGFGIKGFENGCVPIEQNKKWGFLNTDGKLFIPVKYDKVTEFNSDHAIAENAGHYFILNKQGAEISVEVPLKDLKPFSEQLAPYKTVDDKFGFIDVNGKIAIQAQYSGVGYFHAGLAWAKQADKSIGFINPKGEWVIKPQFTTAKNFDLECGLARVKVGDKWAYVNKTGEISYMNDSQIIEDFSDGLAKGKKNEKIGFYNPKGDWVIQPQFDAARDFKNGYAAAKKDGKWGIIDKTGKWVIEASFDEIKDVELVK